MEVKARAEEPVEAEARDRRDRRAAHANQERADEAGQRIEGRRAAGRAPGHVDDGRPRELIEDDLRFREEP